MPLNLNDPLGFAKLTLSSASTALNTLLGAINQKWDIQEGSYGHPELGGTAVLFHVFGSAVDYSAGVSQIQDTSGRRKVPFSFPYVDGQTTDDLGREGEAIDIDILLHGPNYYKAYKRLIAEFNDPVPGTLIHPVRGAIRCGAKDWVVTHSSQQTQAVALRVRFVEHNFDYSFEEKAPTTKSKIVAAVQFIGVITNVINKIESNVFAARSIVNSVNAAIREYQELFGTTLSKLNATFNPGSSDDIPTLLPDNDASSNFVTAGSPGDETSSLLAGLSPQQAVDEVSRFRDVLNETIATMSESGMGQGSLFFYNEIQSLKASGIAIQEVLEIGLQSSKARVLQYTVPREMSMREVAFANKLSPEIVNELQIMNPDLLSNNLIPAGTVLKVPTA